MQLTLFLVSPSAAVRGRLRCAFLEPHPNLFVGSLATNQAKELIEYLEMENCSGIVIAHSKRCPMGVRIKNIGPDRERKMHDLDGLQLVKRLSKQ